MEPRLRRKLFAVLFVTVLFGLAYGMMYILWARFEAGYFYTAFGAYVLLLALALIFVGRKPRNVEDEVERDLQRTALDPAAVSPDSGRPRPPVAQLEGPDGLALQVEKATGMIATPTTPAETVGYTFRGFTLYERATKTGPQRFFASGKPVGGGTPIPLPAGHRARWDPKKKRPFLEEDPEPKAPEEEFVVSKPTAAMPSGVTRRGPAVEEPQPLTSAGRPCAAFTSPGIMCTRSARGESPYCAAHANYKPDSVTQEFEVRHDTAASSRKPFRGGVGDFEVHVAKPNAKPLRFKAPTVEVQTARPSTHPAPPPKGSRGKPVKPAKPGKPLKGLMDRPFEVRVAKRAAKPLKITGAAIPAAVVAKPKASGKLRVAPASSVVVRTARPNAKPVKLKQGREPIVRPAASLADTKPLRLRVQDDFDVSTARGSLTAPNNRKVRCKATLANGKRCSNDARGGADYCTQHKSFRPRVEAVVVRDTRARSEAGVGDQDRPGRKR